MRLFLDRTGAVIFTMGFLLMGSLLAVTTFLPLFLQVATGASATRSGLMLTPQSIGISLVATVGGILVSRSGRYRWSLLLGPLVSAASLWWLTTIDPDTGFVELAPILFVFGAGLGLIFPNLTLTIQNASAFEDLGIADPDHLLGVGSGSHAKQTADVMVAFEQRCLEDKPDAIVVLGDCHWSITPGLSNDGFVWSFSNQMCVWRYC